MATPASPAEKTGMADGLLLAVGQVACGAGHFATRTEAGVDDDGQAPFRRAMLYSGEIAS